MVALNFHWREIGRQVRLRGRVLEGSADDAARDFIARSAGSRAQALTGNQSQPLRDPKDLERAIGESRQLLEADDDLVPEHWALFGLIPDEVEFWQADTERRHTRLQYRFEHSQWRRRRLWP